MSLYHEAANVLTAPGNTSGSLKSRIFNSKTLKSQPARLYALVIETCKWSLVLKEVIERASLLTLERKLTPVLSLLLVHDLLLAKGGIALPSTHGLRAAVERHKTRLHAELTKARIGRKLGTMDALKQYVDSGGEHGSIAEPPHPRWIRINTLKTQLEDQLETTFVNYERVGTIDAVRRRDSQCLLYIDGHVPNLIAIPAFIDLTKSEPYKSGAIIFQDKASCFPAYLLDPLPEDRDIIDTCAAPGNKTTHLGAILALRAADLEEQSQTIHAFEKDIHRAESLKNMVTLSGCLDFTKVHAGEDFLKTDPKAPEYRNVGALLLDPSCSGSGIIGRDDMHELHLPSQSPVADLSKGKGKTKSHTKTALKRKRGNEEESPDITDNGAMTLTASDSDLQARLQSLSAFQLSLILHAFAFPSAHKITYSTCSTHSAENEAVVTQALASATARRRGWRILRRDEQVRGMREWPIRGDREACSVSENADEVAEACIRTRKDGEYGTMGFFVAGFVRDRNTSGGDMAARVMRDERGFIVRDRMGIPILAEPESAEEWGGFSNDDDDSTPGSGSKGEDDRVSSKAMHLRSPQTSDGATMGIETPHKPGKRRKRGARKVK